MKNIKEIIILSGVLACFFAFAITKVSFAYQEVSKEEELKNGRDNALILAAEAYISFKKEEFTKEETFLYGSDLIDAGFLIDIDDLDYANAKIKVLPTENGFRAEIVE